MTSRTSEPLVPNDLPYGQRQDVRAGMKRAGMPLAPPTGHAAGPIGPGGIGPGGGAAAPPAPASGLDLIGDTTPGDFPFLTEPAPDAQPTDQTDSPLAALTASSQSTFGRAVLARLAAARG